MDRTEMCGESEPVKRAVAWSQLDMNALQRGSGHANGPIDHRCGSGEFAEGVTFDEMIMLLDARLDEIRHLHHKIDTGIGDVDGSCAECDHRWPCPSYHVAAGFGLDAFYECEKHRWCSHLGVPLR